MDGFIKQTKHLTMSSNPMVWSLVIPFSNTEFNVFVSTRSSGVGYSTGYVQNANFSSSSVKIATGTESGMSPTSTYCIAEGY